MSDYILIVTSNAKEGREDEYNDWYDNIHLGEVAALDGFCSAQRFEPAEAPKDGSPQRYVAIYEFDTQDPGMAMKGLGEAAQNGTLNMSDTLDNVTLTVYRARTGKISG